MQRGNLAMLIAVAMILVLLHLSTTTDYRVSTLFSSSRSAQSEIVNQSQRKVVNTTIAKASTSSSIHSTNVSSFAKRNAGLRMLPRFTRDSFLKTPNDSWCANLSNHDPKPTILLLVLSAVAEFNLRQVLRGTLNITNYPSMRLYFVLGVPTTSTSATYSAIDGENLQFDDIIQANFLDTYDNLTLKSLAVFSWAAVFCPNVDFVLKMDSDVVLFINQLYLFATSQYLSFGKKLEGANTIYGRLWRGATVIRNPRDKWYVPPGQYNDSVYPDYCAGPAYLMTGDVPKRIVQAAVDAPFIRVEDVLFTGILATKANSRRIAEPRFSFTKLDRINCSRLPITVHIRDPIVWMQMRLYYEHQRRNCS